MPSPVNIASNALLLLGAEPINSFDDSAAPAAQSTARIAANLWPQVRDAALRAHYWNCAITRVHLSPLESAPAFGFQYQYQLPGDPYWLRNVEINGSDASDVDYLVEGRRLLCDLAAVNLRYVYRNEDPDSWDATLVDAVTLLMAARMAYTITSSTSREQSLLQQYEMAIKNARAYDGMDESSQVLGDGEILAARRGAL